MLKIKQVNSSLLIFGVYKTFLKSSRHRSPTNSKNFFKNSKLMFLRAPKHFKVGKQFLSVHTSKQLVDCSLHNINILNLLTLNSVTLYNLFSCFNKTYLPETYLTRVTYSVTVVCRLNDWCSVYKYSS